MLTEAHRHTRGTCSSFAHADRSSPRHTRGSRSSFARADRGYSHASRNTPTARAPEDPDRPPRAPGSCPPCPPTHGKRLRPRGQTPCPSCQPRRCVGAPPFGSSRRRPLVGVLCACLKLHTTPLWWRVIAGSFSSIAVGEMVRGKPSFSFDFKKFFLFCGAGCHDVCGRDGKGW